MKNKIIKNNNKNKNSKVFDGSIKTIKPMTKEKLKRTGKMQHKLGLIVEYSELYNEFRHFLDSRGVTMSVLDLEELTSWSCDRLEKAIYRLDGQFEHSVDLLW